MRARFALRQRGGKERREADFTTLPPLYVRHPPLHREGYNKITPSAARPLLRARGTSLIGLPKKDLPQQRFFGKRRSRHQSLAPTKEGQARFALLRRGRQGIAGSPCNYSLSLAADVPSDSKTASRAVEPALGQGMARSMCHSQARKRSKPHLVAARRLGLRRASFAA